MSIHDQPNISLLISILETEFNRQSVRQPQFVKFFNDKLENYHERRFNYANLGDLNKHILTDCFQYISRQNSEIEKNTMVLKTPSQSNNPHTFQSPSDNTTQQNTNTKSDASFDNYKKQYDTMLNPKKPGEIDFSDTIDDQPIENIDSIVNQTLADRQKELERITNTYSEKPPDWIKPPIQDNHKMKLIIEENEPTHQPKPSSNSILKTKQPSSSKKVTFDMKRDVDDPVHPKTQVIAVHNLLSKLKSKSQDTSTHPPPFDTEQSVLGLELEKRIYDKIEANVEAKFAILNEKYQQLQVKYEELSMKYGELIINHDIQEDLLN